LPLPEAVTPRIRMRFIIYYLLFMIYNFVNRIPTAPG
jgi:hypothetical protein